MDFFNLLKDKYDIDLNEQQQEAVKNIHGATLLLSVPGGGKTTVIVSRIANMILNHNIRPDKILTLTFSRASAFDMKNRFDRIFGGDISQDVQFSTIHSFCYSVISKYVNKMGRKFPAVIEGAQGEHSRNQILKQIYLRINDEYVGEDVLEDLSSTISYVKNMLYNTSEIQQYDTQIYNFPQIFNAYEKYKREARLIDYDDMLTGTYSLFKKDREMLNIFRSKYHYINVDESQDTSLAQHELIKLLAQPKNNIFMVGDEDQSIYGFRAAFPQALLDFEKIYPKSKILLMERNYRSTADIVKPANIFIKQNKARFDKNMFTLKEALTPIQFVKLRDKNEQYGHIISSIDSFNSRINVNSKQYSDCAVLYRNNISAISFVDYLERKNIPFYLKETNVQFFNHWMVIDIISFIKLSFNESDKESFRQIYYKLNAFLSKDMFEYALAEIDKHKNVFEALLHYPEIPKRAKGAIIGVYKNIKRIPKMKPYKAIEFIENNLNYKLYLLRMNEEKGYSLESLNQVLDSIKTIATDTQNFDDFFNRLSHLQDIIKNSSKNKNGNAITLSTIHSAKGLEFDNVFIIDLIEGQFPSSKSIDEYNCGGSSLMEEEVRLFYVGITRARENLQIITFNISNKRGIAESRFVNQLINAQNKMQITSIK